MRFYESRKIFDLGAGLVFNHRVTVRPTMTYGIASDGICLLDHVRHELRSGERADIVDSASMWPQAASAPEKQISRSPGITDYRLARQLILKYSYAMKRLLGIALVIASAASAGAQARYDFDSGTVEVMGLRKWTLRMLRDSIKRYAPGQDLHDAACMVTLRDSLHFVEASVNDWVGFNGPDKSFLSIKVVEPGQRATVKWDVRPRNEISSLLPDYAPLILAITDSTGAVWRGRLSQWIQYYNTDSATRAKALNRVPETRRATAKADAERVWAFLANHQAETDRVRAMKTLHDDGFWVNRFVAASVLLNFPTQDSTWWTLVRTLRDPQEDVRDFANYSLRQMPKRRVDWSPVASDLRLLLNGTNLPSIESVFELLDRTEVSPSLAAPLLRRNAGWLLDHLGSRAPMASDLAHKLLVRLNNGRDLGTKRAPWERWVASL